ncbi:hypothetical protein Tco_0243729, partial [Tanacetum coccineum]
HSCNRGQSSYLVALMAPLGARAIVVEMALVALVAPLGARAIVVEMELVALGQGSPVRLPFARPHVVDFGDILPFEGLLLVTMVVSG